MPTFPEEVIADYITTHITEDYNHSPDGNWININSVFTSDGRYRMGFNIPDNYVHDFKAGEGWGLEEFIAMYQEIPESEARKILMKIYMKYLKSGKKLSITKPQRKIAPVIDLDEIKYYPELKNFDKESLRKKIPRKIIRYLMNRDFHVKHIQKFHLKYTDQYECYRCDGVGEILGRDDAETCPICKGSGRNPYYGWLIIPSYEDGKLVYYQGRNPDKEAKFRYMNPKGIAKTQVVFFYDQLKENSRIFITEGPTDAMTLYNESVACIMGNRISDPQAQKLLKKNPTEIIFIPDWDETPEKRKIISKALSKNIKTINRFAEKDVKIGIYKWYKRYSDRGKDLNDVGHTEIEEDLISYYEEFKSDVQEKLQGVVN